MDNLDMIPEDQREAYWQRRVDSLTLELAACEHQRLRDNQYLIDQRDNFNARLAECQAAHQQQVELSQQYLDEQVRSLDLVSRIREALGDNGKRMQDELIVYCAELRDKAWQYDELSK